PLPGAGRFDHLDAGGLPSPVRGRLLVLGDPPAPTHRGLGLLLRGQGQGLPRLSRTDGVVRVSAPAVVGGATLPGGTDADPGEPSGPGRTAGRTRRARRRHPPPGSRPRARTRTRPGPFFPGGVPGGTGAPPGSGAAFGKDPGPRPVLVGLQGLAAADYRPRPG